jgi:p70 ribosomal S6 kinase
VGGVGVGLVWGVWGLWGVWGVGGVWGACGCGERVFSSHHPVFLLSLLLFTTMPFFFHVKIIRYDLIQKADLRIPGFVSNDAKELLRGLLQLLPENRLGYGPKDCASIQATPFFSSLNWDDCIARKIQPKFVPQVRGDTDVQFFDKEFTNEKVVDSVVPTSRMGDTTKAADDFGGFTFEPQGKMGPG